MGAGPRWINGRRGQGHGGLMGEGGRATVD